MLPFQWELLLIVVKRLAIGIYAIVASQAVHAKGLLMTLHISGVQVAVAGATGCGFKAGDVCAMATSAGKVKALLCLAMGL